MSPAASWLTIVSLAFVIYATVTQLYIGSLKSQISEENENEL